MIVARDVSEPVSGRRYTEHFVRCQCGKESAPRGSRPMALTLAAVDGFLHVDGNVHWCADCARKEAA